MAIDQPGAFFSRLYADFVVARDEPATPTRPWRFGDQPFEAVNTSDPNVAGTLAASASRGRPSSVSQLASDE
jgi:hypothetical protein